MKKTLAVAITTLLVGMSGLASAYTINYTYNSTTDGGYTSPYAGVMVETFDAPLLFSWAGDYAILTGSVIDHNASPFGLSSNDSTQYITTPDTLGLPLQDSVRATNFGGTFYTYLGLWWGSADSYNNINFYKGSDLVQTITGTEAISPSDANGHQLAPTTNLYINFLELPAFDSFELVSTNYAFEADNIAVGMPVPEPGTILLLGAGFLGLAIYGKRRKNA